MFGTGHNVIRPKTMREEKTALATGQVFISNKRPEHCPYMLCRVATPPSDTHYDREPRYQLVRLATGEGLFEYTKLASDMEELLLDSLEWDLWIYNFELCSSVDLRPLEDRD